LEHADGASRAIRGQPEERREVLKATSDDHLLNTNWRMLSAGKVMTDQPRYIGIRDGVFNHLAHHRGQLTVYLG